MMIISCECFKKQNNISRFELSFIDGGIKATCVECKKIYIIHLSITNPDETKD